MNRHIAAALAVALVTTLTGCVHEWPEDDAPATLRLLVTHDTGWTQFEMTVSRTLDTPARARYHFRIERAGSPGTALYEVEFYNNDLLRNDFVHTLQLSPGQYDLWAWSDYADAATDGSWFFDSSDFGNITYSEPYNGNNEYREAFRGMTSFTVPATPANGGVVTATLNMERPMAMYRFVATDLNEFINAEASRGQGRNASGATPADAPSRAVNLADYRIRMIYTGYMPSEFNNYTNRPVNSRTGMEYDATISDLGNGEAMLGFDHVLVNGTASSVMVALEVYDADNNMIGRTRTIEVPTKRGQRTTVRGKFLTSVTNEGVGIVPDYDGEFNIEIN